MTKASTEVCRRAGMKGSKMQQRHTLTEVSRRVSAPWRESFPRKRLATLAAVALAEARFSASVLLAYKGIHSSFRATPRLSWSRLAELCTSTNGLPHSEPGIDVACPSQCIQIVCEVALPAPWHHPTCSARTYAFVDGDQEIPIPCLVKVDDYLDFVLSCIGDYSVT